MCENMKKKKPATSDSNELTRASLKMYDVIQLLKNSMII